MTTFDIKSEQEWNVVTNFLLDQRDKNAKLTVTIRPFRKKRSRSANAFYWGAVIPPLCDHFGYRPYEMHMAILGTYVGWEEKTFQGRTLFVPRRTSTTPDTMDTVDYLGLTECAMQIAAEEGIVFPEHNS